MTNPILTLVPMSYREAFAFCGNYGANFVMYKKSDNSMDMYRLYQTEGGKLITLTRGNFSHEMIVPEDEYDLYWVGSMQKDCEKGA